MNISIQDLADSGVHFGHQLRRWNPKSKGFIYDHRQGVSIIDLEKTHALLEKASQFVEDLVASGKDILFVGTKRQAQEVIREAATECGMPFCANRWLGGALTNFSTIKRSLEKYKCYLAMETDGSMGKLHKKEASAIRREMQRMHRNFEGMLNLPKPPAALFVVDIKSENIAVAEAKRLGIPVVALVDTNSDPTGIDYPIPGNDDAVKAVRLIVGGILEAIQNGLSRRESQKAMPKFNPIVQQDAAETEGEVTLSAELQQATDGEAGPAKTES